MTDIETELSAACQEGLLGATPVTAPVHGPLRLDVIAMNTADVVASTGGWMCDRVRNGWAVNVFLVEENDIRPLQILGVTARAFHSLNDIPQPGGRPHVLAAATDVILTDRQVRADVARALRHERGRVAIWGDPLPPTLDRRFQTFRHHLSPAARAFKEHALGALADRAVDVLPVEEIRGRFKTFGLCDSDLTPVRIGHLSRPPLMAADAPPA